MNISINGECRVFSTGATLQHVLNALGMEPARVAVELNGKIVERERFASVLLNDGDQLELIRFVGGG